MMGTEIFKIDASCAEKLTKTRVSFLMTPTVGLTPQSTEGPYLDHGETTNESIEKVYVTTLVTTMGLFKYVDGGNSKITPKK